MVLRLGSFVGITDDDLLLLFRSHHVVGLCSNACPLCIVNI